VALVDACRWLLGNNTIKKDPVYGQVAAVSVGIYNNTPVLDLDYQEHKLAA